MAELCDLISFGGMFVHPEVGGTCDFGFSFRCTWDEEHGLGVLVRAHGEIEVGPPEKAWEGVDLM